MLNLKNYINDLTYIIKHKVIIYQIWKKEITKVSLYRVIMHDTEKLFLCLLIGDKYATKIHRKYARHHNLKSFKDFSEAYLDFASARFTKPDKPLDAIETCEKYYPHLLNQAIEHYRLYNYK